VTRRVVVVGTGTGVGKTWVAEAIVRGLAARGLGVGALKPVETGVAQPESNTDFQRLAAVSTFPVKPQPYRFVPPISPHLAARQAARSIELEQILTYVQSHESSSADWLLIETAGGLFSPLSREATNFDLARALDPALWLLVASDSLGVLHDVSATLSLSRFRGREPDHLLLSSARLPDESTGTNAAELETLGIVGRVFTAGRDDPESVSALVTNLLR
jgi:dethiobiotin synthetase